jgi:hypothetical protein
MDLTQTVVFAADAEPALGIRENLHVLMGGSHLDSAGDDDFIFIDCPSGQETYTRRGSGELMGLQLSTSSSAMVSMISSSRMTNSSVRSSIRLAAFDAPSVHVAEHRHRLADYQQCRPSTLLSSGVQATNRVGVQVGSLDDWRLGWALDP